MNNITQTQHDAYDELKFSKRDLLQKEKVYNAYLELKCAPRKQIAEHLNIPINIATGRTNDLIREGKLVVAFHREYKSRTKVEFLRPIRQGEIIFDKPLTKIQKIERICKSSDSELAKQILDVIKNG